MTSFKHTSTKCTRRHVYIDTHTPIFIKFTKIASNNLTEMSLIFIVECMKYLKKGLREWTMPSLEWSFSLVNRTDQSGSSDAGSTANPWFWVVMKQRLVPAWVHGWFRPRLPYLVTHTHTHTHQAIHYSGSHPWLGTLLVINHNAISLLQLAQCIIKLLHDTTLAFFLHLLHTEWSP